MSQQRGRSPTDDPSGPKRLRSPRVIRASASAILQRKRVRGVMLAVVGVIVATTVIGLRGVIFSGDDPSVDQPPVVVQGSPFDGEVSKTSLAQVRERFGPWHLGTPQEAPVGTIVMLLQSGGVDISDTTVDTSADQLSWFASRPLAVRRATVDHSSVIIQTSEGTNFQVAPGQPFIVESAPDFVLFVDQDGTVWQRSSSNIPLPQTTNSTE